MIQLCTFQHKVIEDLCNYQAICIKCKTREYRAVFAEPVTYGLV